MIYHRFCGIVQNLFMKRTNQLQWLICICSYSTAESNCCYAVRIEYIRWLPISTVPADYESLFDLLVIYIFFSFELSLLFLGNLQRMSYRDFSRLRVQSIIKWNSVPKGILHNIVKSL